MAFSDFFHPFNMDGKTPQNGSSPDIERAFKALMPDPKPAQDKRMLSFPFLFRKKEENDMDRLHKIPLEKRMGMLVDTGIYQKALHEMVEKEIREIKQEKLEKIKKEHPELAGKLSPKRVKFIEGAEELIRDRVATMFIDAVLTKEEIKEAVLHLIDPKQTFTKTDMDVLKICIHVWRHNLEFLAKNYGVKKGVFQSIIARGATDLADMIGSALKQDPRTIISYGVECCRGIKGFDRGETAMRGDRWVAKWLDPKMVKALSQAKQLKPLVGMETEKPTPDDMRRTHRYQSGFKNALLYYCFKSPTKAQSVFGMMIPYLERMDLTMQEQMWAILFQKYQVDPEIQPDVVKHMSSFLETCSSDKSKRMMYSVFVKTTPSPMRAEILGGMKPKALRRYCHAFQKTYRTVPFAPLKTEEGHSYVAWELFYRGDISQDQMSALLKQADLKWQKNFVFSNKKQMNTSIFSDMCGRFADTPFYFWQWIRSFQSIPDFKGSLAKIYPMLPSAVKENKNYISEMDNHFELVRECAVAGDTASLSALKKILEPQKFWQSLTWETADKISGIRSLCRQGKRGLLKLMADWPMEKQQALFMTVDANGRTLLDDCTGSLERLVAQDIFKQVYQKSDAVTEISAPTKDVPVAPESIPTKEAKKTVQRQIFRIPLFEGHMAKYVTNPKLLQEVEDTIIALSQMDKAEIQAELREGWKTGGGVDKNPCVVKDIRGNNYRLGYLLQGDTDKGTGKIAFLFFLTHAQYDNFLNKQADQAVRVATLMMNAATPQPTTLLGPIGPGGGNEGR